MIFNFVYSVVAQKWVVTDMKIDTPIYDAGTRILEAHITAVVKQEELGSIVKVIQLFGKKGATLPEICGMVDQHYILFILEIKFDMLYLLKERSR